MAEEAEDRGDPDSYDMSSIMSTQGNDEGSNWSVPDDRPDGEEGTALTADKPSSEWANSPGVCIE